MDFIWILFAFACGMLFKLASLPPLIGYLLAGFLLHLMGQVPDESLQTLADLGITLMLFTIGLKLKTGDLLKREVWLGSSVHILLWCSLSFAILLFLSAIQLPLFIDIDDSSAAIIAFALSFSSTVCIVKLLEDNGELSTRHGRLAVAILVMQDIIAVVYLVVITGKTPSLWAFLLVLVWMLKPFLKKLVEKAGHSELLPLAGIFLALGSYQAFELVGIKGDLGALVAGLLLSGTSKATELAKSLLSFKDLFLIGFFVSIGFTALPDWTMLFSAVILSLLLLIKFTLFFFIFCSVRLRGRTSFLSALALTNFSEFGLIVLALSSQLGLVAKEWLVVVALSVSISFVFTSILYHFAHKIFARWKRRFKRFETKLRLREDVYLLPKTAEILVVGMGRVGRGAYVSLNQLAGDRVWGVDANRDRVRKYKRSGMKVFPGDGEDPDLWENLDLTEIKLILLALPSVQDSHNITEQLRRSHFTGKIAAIARYEDEKERLLHIGIDKVFNFFTEAGTGFAEESLQLIERRELGEHLSTS
ncbi:cation:proton antiporter family protein [Aliikangiella coralliicola]|uniref:Potassium transporter Kef n=1 Tax=Aliikangiella coralliicola TaxID=2592383 RepID=A0A545UIB0_9GAMM|nr:cation:proton antiporter family protein [Aliikangiella coralliicola]TQV89199.1 potassium transporter Kef [Aliikangiella coralliicola]